jgi:hypothetical protein
VSGDLRKFGFLFATRVRSELHALIRAAEKPLTPALSPEYRGEGASMARPRYIRRSSGGGSKRRLESLHHKLTHSKNCGWSRLK